MLKDRTYAGSAKDGIVKVKVRVTVKNQSIAKVELLQHRALKGKEAEKIVIDRIIDKQSTDVDAAASATTSSRVIMNAVEASIQNAKYAMRSSLRVVQFIKIKYRFFIQAI